MKPRIILIFFAGLLTAAGILYYFFYQNNLKYFPSRQKVLEIMSITDINEGGASTILDFDSRSERVRIQYHLSNKINYPYCGVLIDSPEFSVIDVSGHQDVKLRIASDLNTRLRLQIKLFIPGYSESFHGGEPGMG